MRSGLARFHAATCRHDSLLPQALRGIEQSGFGIRLRCQCTLQQCLRGSVIFQRVQRERLVILQAVVDVLEAHFQSFAVERGDRPGKEALQVTDVQHGLRLPSG